jgi:predicted nucleic acid-binding protein
VHYVDASVIVALLVKEAATRAVQNRLRSLAREELAASEWGRLEVCSVLRRGFRDGSLRMLDEHDVFARLDVLLRSSFAMLVPTIADFDSAGRFVRAPNVALRGGDALHLAIAANRGARAIHTLDKGMVRAGKTLALPIVLAA